MGQSMKPHSNCALSSTDIQHEEHEKIMHRFLCLQAKKKVLKSYDFRTFLVEISGIEPLTS